MVPASAPCHCPYPESSDGGQGPALFSQLEPAWEAKDEGMGRARRGYCPQPPSACTASLLTSPTSELTGTGAETDEKGPLTSG